MPPPFRFSQAHGINRTIAEREVPCGVGPGGYFLSYICRLGTRFHRPLIPYGGFCFRTADRGTSRTCGKHNPKNGARLFSLSLSAAQRALQNLRQILFTQRGKLMGLITKSDIVDLLTVHLPHRAALADFVENRRG